MEHFIQSLSNLDPIWVYLVVAAVAYVENVFPPFPSDVVVVAAGSLISIGRVEFAFALLLSTIGSTLGFVTMFKVGDWFGVRILETGRLKFIPVEQVHKVEGWFKQYGYGIVVANRFLSGTRAVVSFFAGMSRLSLSRTTLLSFLSALAWNFALLFGGMQLGQNWRSILWYLEAYGEMVTLGVLLVLVAVLARRFYKKRMNASSVNNGSMTRGEETERLND